MHTWKATNSRQICHPNQMGGVPPLWLLGRYKQMWSFANLKSRQYWSVIFFMVTHNHCRGAHKPEGVSRLYRAQVCRDSLCDPVCQLLQSLLAVFVPSSPSLLVKQKPISIEFPLLIVTVLDGDFAHMNTWAFDSKYAHGPTILKGKGVTSQNL